MPEVKYLAGVHSYKNEQQDAKGQQGGTTIAEKGQRDADNRKQPNGHADIHGKMEKENAGYTVTVNTHKSFFLLLGQIDNAQQQGHKEGDKHQAAKPTMLLAYGTENKIGALLRHKIEGGLGAVEKALAGKATRADGNLALGYIPAYAQRVHVGVE